MGSLIMRVETPSSKSEKSLRHLTVVMIEAPESSSSRLCGSLASKQRIGASTCETTFTSREARSKTAK